MKFIGNNYLSLSPQTGVSFNLKLSIDNLSGISQMGFFGVKENLQILKSINYDPMALYLFKSAVINTMDEVIPPAQFQNFDTASIYSIANFPNIPTKNCFRINDDWVDAITEESLSDYVIPTDSILVFGTVNNINISIGGGAIIQKYYDDKIEFKFTKGEILDPEGRNIYSYQSNEEINVSGNINPGAYSYYINNKPGCLDGKSNINQISGFYINNINCETDCELDIYGKKPNWDINMNNIFYIKSGNYLNGLISGNSNFKIYSGVVIVPTGFSIAGFPSDVSPSGVIVIDPYQRSSLQVESEKKYSIEMRLYTNFGDITKIFESTGSYSGFFNLNLALFPLAPSGQGEPGLFKDNPINFIYTLESGDLRSAPTIFDKNLNLEFSYYGGETGNISYNVFGSGYKNINVTGFLNGSGYLGKTDLILTGYDFLSGTQVARYMTGVPDRLFFVTGFVTKEIFNTPVTGYYFNNQYVTTLPTYITGFAFDGMISYNNYTYPVDNKFFTSVNSVSTPGFLDIYSTYIDSNESGTILLVSTPIQSNHPSGIASTGRVFIYTGQNNNNGVLGLARSYSGLAGDRSFGVLIHKSQTGNSFLIGSSRFGVQGGSGRFYIFDDYSQDLNSAKLLDFSGQDFDNEFAGVIAGDTVCVGIGSALNNTGIVNIYENTGTILSLRQTLTGYASGRFGRSLGITHNRDIISVSARFESPSGQVYIFTGDNFNYKLLNKLNRSGESSDPYPKLGDLQLSQAFSRDGNAFALGGWENGPSNHGIFYIFTGNKNNKFNQVFYESGDASLRELGVTVKFNSIGDTLLVTNGYGLVNPLKGSVYTGNNNKWNLYHRFDGGTPNKLAIATIEDNQNIYYRTNVSPSRIDTIYNINYSGYFSGSQIATGIINTSSSSSITGLITGLRYAKTLVNSFEIETGYYLSGSLLGVTTLIPEYDNMRYASQDTSIDKNIDTLYLNIKSRNYDYLGSPLIGKLSVTGRSLDESKSGVIHLYITGG